MGCVHTKTSNLHGQTLHFCIGNNSCCGEEEFLPIGQRLGVMVMTPQNAIARCISGVWA